MHHHPSFKPKNIKSTLKKNKLGWRIFLAVICYIVLFTFLHFREIRIEMPPANSTASHFIVSQIDFSFPDDEATLLNKQKALKEASGIYQIDDKHLRNFRIDFENEVIKNHQWKEIENNTSYQDIYQLAESIEDVLKEIRFADAKTIEMLKTCELSNKHYLIFSSSLEDNRAVLCKEFWRHLKDFSLFSSVVKKMRHLSPSVIQHVVDYFQKQDWTLKEDQKMKMALHDAIKKQLPQKYSTIPAGATIIAQKEKVTFRHLAMLQAMKEAMKKNQNLWVPIRLAGNAILALVLLLISIWYLHIEHYNLCRSLRKVALLSSILVISLVLGKIVELVIIHNPTDFIEFGNYPLIIPFAAILLAVLLNSQLALYGTLFLLILFSVGLSVDINKFLLVNFAASFIVVYSAKSLRKRQQIFRVCAKSLYGIIPLIFAFYFLSNQLWNSTILADIVTSAIFMIVTAILVVGLLPILETLFNIMTDITLVEYMDPNNELLRRLTMEVPGTYQHSLVLGNLAESAAQAINANALLCKVATLYHDAGKLNNAHYFSENQQGGINIHQLLTPVESAQVIISHIKDGEIIAKKYRLPDAFIDIIKQHHGTTLVYYFYCKEIELKGGNIEEVDEKQFRYPGPKPQTKEAAIIMLADAIEATSRSLEELTEESLTEMIDRIIVDRIEDGQFDECNLTFEELQKVKEALIKTILITRHVRIKYPEKKS